MILELGPYELRLLTVAGCYALMVLGYQFIFGHAGALSLAQGAFFGLGAYTTGLLATKLGWGFALTLPLSVLAPVAVAGFVAAPVLRLESHYFALATLGIAQVTLLAAVNWTELTGGANGIAGVPGVRIAGETLPRGWPMLALVWGLVLAGAAASSCVLRGRWGKAFELLRENPVAAAAVGLDGGRMRLAAFLASAAYAGLGGALYVHTLRVISPEVLGFPIMVACLAMTVIGGRVHVAGAILGALLLVHLPEWFRVFELYRNVAFGAALLLMMIVAPFGIAGTIALGWPRRASAPKPVAPLPCARTAAASPLLEVSEVSKDFGGVRALDRVSLTIGRGEIVGLIGPNGSGKTTLINVVSGLVRPDGGDVRLGGKSIVDLRPHEIARRGIARSFQNLALAEEMTVLDSVAVARCAPWPQARAEAMHFLARLDLDRVAHERLTRLGHALRRQVEIARALALDPDLVLLDEPAAGLNATEQAELAARLAALAAEGMSLLVVEHNMPFLLGLAHRVVCLDGGRVIAAGAPSEIRRAPRVIEAYLGASG